MRQKYYVIHCILKTINPTVADDEKCIEIMAFYIGGLDTMTNNWRPICKSH